MRIVLVGAELEENLALRYLCGALAAEGHEAILVAFDREDDLERAAREIATSEACIAGFSMVFTRRADEFARLVTRCRELGFRGLTVAGGHFAAFHCRELLRDVPAIDVVAIGEGERILCEMARKPNATETVPNLVWRNGDDVSRSTMVLPEQDLDTIPWPTRRHPFDHYLGLPIVNMIGSRGCTHACAFCSIAAWNDLCGGDRYRERSPASIVAEMVSLHAEGVRLFNFHDDNFLGRDRIANLARVRALRSEMKKQGLGRMAFQIKARPDSIDEEVLVELREMGLFRVFLGIEAGTEQSLKQLGRGQKLRHNEEALALLQSIDLHVAFNLLLLNPDSTHEDFAQNVAFLRHHTAHPMNFCRTEVYEGTPLARRLRKQNRLRGDYWGLDYVIADPRAERAFQMIRLAFWERNFGTHPLHYLSGQVDYEHQIRMDFFGTTPALRAAAKGFVRRVNESTVAMLEEVVKASANDVDVESFGRDLTARVAADDERLHAEGQAVLRKIRELPSRTERVPTRSHASRAHTAIAASVALALASCTPKETQHAEMAPPPPPQESGAPPNYPTHMAEMVAEPPPLEPDAGPIDATIDATSDAKGDTKGDAIADTKKPIPPHPSEMVAPPPTAKPTPTPPHHMEAAPPWKGQKP